MTEKIDANPPAAPSITGVAQAEVDSPGRRALRRFLRHRLAIGALIVLLVIVLLAIFAPAFARYPYQEMSLRDTKSPPTTQHWFGTDRIGRDIWSRTLYGARVSLAVGLATGLLATAIGTTIGALSGYYRGWVDMLLMRFTDIVMTFPSIIIMLTLAALLERSLLNLVLIIGGLSWPPMARLVRGQFLSAREQDFVLAAQCLGVPHRRIMTLHILPNILAPMLAQVTFSVGEAILIESGFGSWGWAPATPSWATCWRRLVT